MKKTANIFVAALLIFFCAQTGAVCAQDIPQALETVTAEDGSVWELVNEPGFGNSNNIAIDALCPFQGSLYALTRNDSEGCELWRTKGAGWEKIQVEGFTDSVLHDYIQGGYGDMIVFKDHLYVASSSGYEGKYYYRGLGCELWRFDGAAWEPIASYSKDDDESGTITAISGCSADDGDTTAQFTDESKSWEADQWKGAGLVMTSGSGRGRYLRITGNTANVLTVQEDEAAFAAGVDVEYTICGEHAPDEDREEVTVGAIETGDSYTIALGTDENGFGEVWNKSIIDLEELDGELYASIGHNYEDGTSIWKSSDGKNWSRMTEYAHGNIHGYDLEGNPTGYCLNEGKEDTVGVPVCTSTTYFGKSDVSGISTLYTGSTGSRGCNGNGARVLRLDDGEWHFIVDYFVDDNEKGTNENGFGDDADGDALRQNFQAWHWTEYDDKLFCGVARPVGCRLAYTDTGSAADDAWTFVVGYETGALPDGFDGVTGPLVFSSNVGMHLFTFNNTLYVGTLKMKLYDNPIPVIDPAWDGADLWKATGTADNLVWTRITSNAFGDENVLLFDSFCTYNDSLYVTAGYYFGKNLDADVPEQAATKIYRLKESPDSVTVTDLNASATRTAVELSWQTEGEKNITGYNVYRSRSEKYNRPYRKLTRTPVAAGSSSYSYTDRAVCMNSTYFYTVEAVSASGSAVVAGPLPVTTHALFDN